MKAQNVLKRTLKGHKMNSKKEAHFDHLFEAFLIPSLYCYSKGRKLEKASKKVDQKWLFFEFIL